MADLGFVRTQLAGISDATTRRVLTSVFTHLLENIRFGVPEHQERAVNLQSYFLNSTTPATANEEFTIVHGLNAKPHVALLALDLGSSGSHNVPLYVTRAADNNRIYLRSTSTSAQVWLLVEP